MASSEQHVQTLEDCVHRFHACPKARLRKRIVQGFFGLTGLLLLVALSPLGGLVSGLSILGIALVALCSYFVVSGSTENAHLFTKVRDLVLGCSFRDWLTAVGILLLFLVVLWLFGVLWVLAHGAGPGGGGRGGFSCPRGPPDRTIPCRSDRAGPRDTPGDAVGRAR